MACAVVFVFVVLFALEALCLCVTEHCQSVVFRAEEHRCLMGVYPSPFQPKSPSEESHSIHATNFPSHKNFPSHMTAEQR